MTEAEIKQFANAVSHWCWLHDFPHFASVTGFTGDYALQKWRDLRSLNSALGAFDAATLAKILSSDTPE